MNYSIHIRILTVRRSYPQPFTITVERVSIDKDVTPTHRLGSHIIVNLQF